MMRRKDGRQREERRYFVYLGSNVAIALFNWQVRLVIGPV